MSQHFYYPPALGNASTTVTANQGTPNNDANAWPVRITDGTHDATVTAGGALNVAISGLANPLPVQDAAAEASLSSIDTKLSSQATAANQATANASLSSIDTKLTAPLSVTGPLTDVQLRASAVPVSVASVPLPTGAATAAKQDTGNTSLASIDSKLTNPLPISGTVTANAGTNLNTSALNLQATQLVFSNKSASAFINSPFDETVITYVGATTNISTVVYKLATVVVNTLTMTYDGSNRLIDVVKS